MKAFKIYVSRYLVIYLKKFIPEFQMNKSKFNGCLEQQLIVVVVEVEVDFCLKVQREKNLCAGSFIVAGVIDNYY